MATTASLFAESNSNNGTAYTTSSAATPTQGDLLVVVVSFQGTTDATCTCTESAGGGTYTQQGYNQWSGTASGQFIFVANQLVGASPPSRTFTVTLPADAATGYGIGIVRVIGLTKTGSAAVVQTGGSKGASGTPAFTFGASVQTGNPTILIAADSTSTAAHMTAPTSWTELHESEYTTPATGHEVASRDSGFTGTTVTWGYSSAGAWGAAGIEVDASAAAEVIPDLVMARVAY